MSARRFTFAFAFSRPLATGSVQVAVPTMRSASPRDSMISVVPWLRRRPAGEGCRQRPAARSCRDGPDGRRPRSSPPNRWSPPGRRSRSRPAAGHRPGTEREAGRNGRDVRTAQGFLRRRGLKREARSYGAPPAVFRRRGWPAGLRTRGHPDEAPSRTAYAVQWPLPRPSPSPLRVSSGFAPDSLTRTHSRAHMGSTGLGKLPQPRRPPAGPSARRLGPSPRLSGLVTMLIQARGRESC